jgi:magnesium chelatase family protein
MVLNSFVRSDFGLRPVKVEVVLTPGVSQIQILGLPDQLIKESTKRILSALRHQNFRLPPGKQAIVNLQPHHLKKSSQGIDLAIAMGILLESEQIPRDHFSYSQNYLYGALTLKGEVRVPHDLQLLNYENFEGAVLTGCSNFKWRFHSYELNSLSEFTEVSSKEPCLDLLNYEEAKVSQDIEFNPQLARLMGLVASGEHSLLIGGHAGSGKTTLVEHLVQLLRRPDEKNYLESKKYWRFAGRELNTRPVVQPHHSITPIAMIGGGNPPRFGEISLAHGGALILDELLEFHPLVQSALREPMEKGKIYVARAGRRQVFPADVLALATTNLCPCGQFHPGKLYSCRCSSQRLRKYMEKLSGPFIDRFAIFYLCPSDSSVAERPVPMTQIKEQVTRAQEFMAARGQKLLNSCLSEAELVGELDSSVGEGMIPRSQSRRRRLSLLRVARTIADMEESAKIKQAHLEEAQGWSSRDMYLIQNFRFDNFATR